MAIRNCAVRKRLLITGTPVMNNLDEFWALADIVNPGTLGSLEDFRRSTARRIEVSLIQASNCDSHLFVTTSRLVQGVARQMIRRRPLNMRATMCASWLKHGFSVAELATLSALGYLPRLSTSYVAG